VQEFLPWCSSCMSEINWNWKWNILLHSESGVQATELSHCVMLFSTFYYLRYCVTDLLTTQLTGSTELSYASNLHSIFSFVYVSRTFFTDQLSFLSPNKQRHATAVLNLISRHIEISWLIVQSYSYGGANVHLHLINGSFGRTSLPVKRHRSLDSSLQRSARSTVIHRHL